MRPILSVIIFLLLISMNGILIGQEPPDSLQLTNTDSMGIDLNHPDLFSRNDFFSDSARIFYAILFSLLKLHFVDIMPGKPYIQYMNLLEKQEWTYLPLSVE